jgi:hypothetical protein
MPTTAFAPTACGVGSHFGHRPPRGHSAVLFISSRPAADDVAQSGETRPEDIRAENGFARDYAAILGNSLSSILGVVVRIIIHIYDNGADDVRSIRRRYLCV